MTRRREAKEAVLDGKIFEILVDAVAFRAIRAPETRHIAFLCFVVSRMSPIVVEVPSVNACRAATSARSRPVRMVFVIFTFIRATLAVRLPIRFAKFTRLAVLALRFLGFGKFATRAIRAVDR